MRPRGAGHAPRSVSLTLSFFSSQNCFVTGLIRAKLAAVDAREIPMQPDIPEAATDEPSVDLRALFSGFLRLGLISFGGALPLARRALVEQRRWLTADEFTELLGLCQFLPGGNVINLAVAVGMRFCGVAGAVAALLGLIAGPSLVVIGLGILYERTQDDPHIRHLFAGLAAAAAGLLISMAVKVVLPLRHRPYASGVAILGFIAIAIVRIPLLPTMLVLLPLSLLLVARGKL